VTPRQVRDLLHAALVPLIRLNTRDVPLAVASLGERSLEIDFPDGTRAEIMIEIGERG
jgi:hypothetical protein